MKESLLQSFSVCLIRNINYALLINNFFLFLFFLFLIFFFILMFLFLIFFTQILLPIFYRCYGLLNFFEIVQSGKHPNNIFLLVHIENDRICFFILILWTNTFKWSQKSFFYFILKLSSEHFITFCSNYFDVVVRLIIGNGKLFDGMIFFI